MCSLRLTPTPFSFSLHYADPPSKMSKTDTSSRASSIEGDTDCSKPGHCDPADGGEEEAAGGEDPDAKKEVEAADAAAAAAVAAAPASAPAAIVVGADGTAIAVTPGSGAPEGVPTAGSVAAPVTAPVAPQHRRAQGGGGDGPDYEPDYSSSDDGNPPQIKRGSKPAAVPEKKSYIAEQKPAPRV